MQYEHKVVQWANDRGIIENSTPIAQLAKTQEELDELVAAVKANDFPEIVDGIGDVMVTLIIVAAMKGLTIESCLGEAYDVIKHRTGRLNKEGVFVKDSP